ncbi:MAG: IS66 family transposase [Hyphomicrobiales bacterium]|nr:IS66 family transposase [Hyphomicrobiales bacterium]
MDRDQLHRLSKDELVELVLKLQRPTKTSRTSSTPPSLDKKERRDKAKPPLGECAIRLSARGGAKPGHKGHFRALHEAPDEIIDHRLDTCPLCQAGLEGEAGSAIGAYDEIELPDLRPFVRRHRRFEVICPQCCVPVKAPVPEVAKRSPFGPRLHGLALYLKSFHSVSFARLEGLFGDVFGLKLSQGALANMLHRGHRPFHKAKRKIVRHLRRANMVASDETGIRIEGLNGYHWIFLSETEVVHEAQLSRAAQVVRDVMGEHKPLLWLSDGYSAQQNHGHHHQTCLAHLARDVAYGLEASQDDVPFRLKLWLSQVFALARNIGTYAASTCKAKKRQLENTLADILLERPDCEVAETLRAKFARASPQLLTFLDFPGEVEVTNNACERGLRPAVIQRKNTNGFRSMWAARGDCAVRTVTDTAKLTGQPPFQTILATLG